MDDRDLDLDLLATGDGEEIDVVDVEGQDVLVEVLDDGELLLALDVDVDDGVDAVVADDRGEVETVDGDVQRLIDGLAVDHDGDQAVAAGTARCALAELGTGCCFERDSLVDGHGVSPGRWLDSYVWSRGAHTTKACGTRVLVESSQAVRPPRTEVGRFMRHIASITADPWDRPSPRR